MPVLNGPSKLWGAHIVPTPAQVALAPADWTQLFIDWDWNGWVKPQIDAAVAAGANFIGMFGCPDGVFSSAISQSTANSRWVQMANYCQSVGICLYPKPCGPPQLTGMTDSDIATFVLSTLNAINGLCTILAVDIIAEANAWNDGGGNATQHMADRCNAIFTLVAAGTSLLGTFSCTYEWNGSDCRTWMARIGNTACNYLDFHPYAMNGWATPVDPADVSYWESTYPGRDIIFGEGGSPQSDSIAQQNAFANGLLYLMNGADSLLRGWCFWAIADQGVTSSNQWGMYTNSFVARQNLYETFKWYASTRPPRRSVFL